MKTSKSPYKRAVALCDSVCRKVVRLRDARRFAGICPLCNQDPIECVFHFISRANMPVRWNWDNLVGSCNGCNLAEHMGRGRRSSDDKFRSLHIMLVGQTRVDELEALAAMSFKKSAAELEEFARQLLKEGEAILSRRLSIHIPGPDVGNITL